MPSIVVHDMDSAWQSSAPALSVAVDPAVFVGTGPASNRFTATTAAVNATAAFNPAAPLDLGLFDELRFWILGDRAADGSPTSPFYLELFYVDASAPALEHRWFVPVNRARSEEHTSELQSPCNLVCRLLLEKKKNASPPLGAALAPQCDRP